MSKSRAKTINDILGRESVHPFPARMAPGIVFDAIHDSRTPLCILDPMMGSGTVPAVARFMGHRGIGVDIDPLAVLISKVWTTSIDVQEASDKASEVLDRARSQFRSLSSGTAYPDHADEKTRAFMRFWFDDYARRQLASLAMSIGRVHNAVVRDVLWCGFSRLIISKASGSSLAMDLSHSRPHRSFDYGPTKPFRKFQSAVNRVAENCVDSRNKNLGPVTKVRIGDARNLAVEDSSMDLVLTSPPYLNAIDYIRCSKFSLVWMGHRIDELRSLRSNSIGTESGLPKRDEQSSSTIIPKLRLQPKLSKRDETMLTRYVDDMGLAIREVERVLKPGGKAIYVIGENTIRGTFVRNSLIVSSLAESSGLKLLKRRVRNLPANRRYLPPPTARVRRAALDDRMRSEVILEFSKPKNR